MSPRFLEIHHQSLVRFGGLGGVQSPELLESAIEQPSMTFGGAFPQEDNFSKAAACLFHLLKIHPFPDGNKQTGLGLALAFPDGNAYPIGQPSPRLHDATMAVAEAPLDKTGFTATLRQLSGVEPRAQLAASGTGG